MIQSIIGESYSRFRPQIEHLLKDVHALVSKTDNPELERVVSDIRKTILEPFLFVVVGEIKAGKSSFVNALLGAEICGVDPAPCTDRIQQIVYAAEPSKTDISPHLRRIGMPVEILKQIAVVDTPGTNTVILHHHEITERFIPSSGLVLFVFPAKNPHTRSAWDLLDYISEEWRKKVVFILQQSDLASMEEMRVNTRKVEEYARERGVESPRIFPTSAKWEMENDPRSGFEPVRSFIRKTITGGRHLYLKTRSVLDTIEQILKRVYDALNQMQHQLEADKLVVNKIENRLDEGGGRMAKEIRLMVDRLLRHYDRGAAEIRTEVEEGLSFISLFKRSFTSLLSKRESMKSWFEDLQKRFDEGIESGADEIAREGGDYFVLSLHEITQGIMETLERMDMPEYREAKEIVHLDDKRDEILADIRMRVSTLPRSEIFSDTLSARHGSMTSNLMQGSAVTLIGVTVLLTTHITLIDITGGILTGAGMLMSGGVLVVKRAKILRDLQKGFEAGRKRLENELVGRLTAKSNLILSDIGRSVVHFIDDVVAREQKLASLLADCEDLHNRLVELCDRLERTER